MESITVMEMMVPLEDYATVSGDATLGEAIFALEEAQRNFDQDHYRHRAILVYDGNGKIVGKLSQLDVLQALEPKYPGEEGYKDLDQYGISADYIRGLIDDLGLLKQPLQDVCRKAADMKVKNVMYTPTRGEYVSEKATLNEAIIQLIIGKHQSLLVTRGREIVGILRLTDVFMKVTDMIKACRV